MSAYPELPAYVKPDLWLDDGNNLVEFVRWRGESEPYMALWWHRRPDGTGWCHGGFAWRNPAPGILSESALWQLVQWEPLHVEPSLLCHSCGAHGFIRGGRWQPC